MFKKKLFTRHNKRGFIVILITFTILLSTFLSVLAIYRQSFDEYNKIRLRSDYVKARYHGESWLAFAVNILKKVPEKQLYMFGVFDGPKPFSYGGNAEIVMAIYDETGKLNLNFLVNDFNDEVNFAVREILDRLSESFGIGYERWDAVIDWIDENDSKLPYGYEKVEYALLNPPRRIKNSPLHTLDELFFIPGFDPWTLYADRRTEEEKKIYSEDFFSDEEKMAVKDDDFKLINNITAYIPDGSKQKAGESPWKININSAPYHIILALSEFMTPKIARAVIVERIKNGGYFANIADISKIPQMSLPSVGKLTLWQEIETRIVFSGTVYKIVVDVSIGTKTARVMGLYDAKTRKLISYLE